MSISRCAVLFTALVALNGAVFAQELVGLRGRHFACGDASKMNLWDISGDSPLIRHEMLQKHYCWKTPSGLGVHLIQRVGRFAHVQHQGNGADFYVYGSDIGPLPKYEKPKATLNKSTDAAPGTLSNA